MGSLYTMKPMADGHLGRRGDSWAQGPEAGIFPGSFAVRGADSMSSHAGGVQLTLSGRHPLSRRQLRVDEADRAGVVVDATRLTFAGPLELAAMVALGTDASLRGEPVTLLVPRDPNVTSYLQRMDVISRYASVGSVVGDIGDDVRDDRADILLEVTQVVEPYDAEVVAQRVVPLARHHAPAQVTRAVFSGIGELLDNACTHAASPVGAYVAAQTYTGATSGRRGLELAVVDCGKGILEHLRQNPRHRDVHDSATAIAHAVMPGVTGTADHRGYGFSDMLASAGEAGVGRLVVRSGDGLGRISVGRRRQRQYHGCPVPIRGTWAWLRIRVP